MLAMRIPGCRLCDFDRYLAPELSALCGTAAGWTDSGSMVSGKVGHAVESTNIAAKEIILHSLLLLLHEGPQEPS
jgi:hypothetical protein